MQPHGIVAHQAPLSMRFPRQEYWSELLFPAPGDLWPRDRNQVSCVTGVSCIAGGFFTDLINCCSVTKSSHTLWDLMDCNMPSFPVLHYFLEFVQIHVHWVSDAIQPSHPLLLCPQSFPASGSFPMSQLFTSGSQSIGASTSASALPMNIQDWFPL